MIRKGVVIAEDGKWRYLLKDVLNDELFEMFISGKLIMNNFKAKIGKEYYVKVSPEKPDLGRILTITDCKMDRKLSAEKYEFDQKLKG